MDDLTIDELIEMLKEAIGKVSERDMQRQVIVICSDKEVSLEIVENPSSFKIQTNSHHICLAEF